MQTTKILTSFFKKDKAEIAGPGHNPTKPQPIPNKLAPTIKFLSKSFLDGIINCGVSIGRDFLLKIKYRGEKVIIAPSITKISEGSHSLNIFKKPITFSGFTIPEMVNPRPNIKPEIREINFVIMLQK